MQMSINNVIKLQHRSSILFISVYRLLCKCLLVTLCCLAISFWYF